MVQISEVKEYDKLKEQQTLYYERSPPSLIDIIDNMERLLRALRKHIVQIRIYNDKIRVYSKGTKRSWVNKR